MKKDEILFYNVRFSGLRWDEILKTETHLKQICTVNLEFLYLSRTAPRFAGILNSRISTFDGMLPFVIAKIFHRNLHFEKISGSDIVMELFERTPHSQERIFVLGCSEEINQSVVRYGKSLGINIAGFSPRLSKDLPVEEENTEILMRIEEFKPTHLLVALGAPKQEFWIDDHFDKLNEVGVRLAAGVGGSFDLLVGAERRAPMLLQLFCLEWLWRLIQRPNRLPRIMRALPTLFDIITHELQLCFKRTFS